MPIARAEKKEARATAKRIGCEPNEWNVAYIRNGLRSGFPECCIDFFVTIWSPLVNALFPDEAMPDLEDMNACQQELAVEVWCKYFDRIESHELPEAGYVPCPACLLKLKRK